MDSAQRGTASYPLEGVKVLDLSQVWASPTAAMYLADQGADVIKVEPPWGDEGRRTVAQSAMQGQARHFFPINRNKRGIVVDITTDSGREIIYKLVEKSDVVIQNLRAHVAERLGYTYEALSRINRRLIYVEVTGYGAKGPYAGQPAYDFAAQAISGLLTLRRWPDGTPMTSGIAVGDAATPILVAYGVALALITRERTGEGQKVETSLLAGTLAMQFPDLVRGIAEESPRSYSAQALYSPYMCQDGEYLILVVINDREWHSLCKVLGLEHIASDPRWKSPIDRAQSSEELYQLISGILSTKPRDEWLRLLRAASIVSAPVLSREEVFHNEQILANELIVEVEQPPVGKIRTVGIPIRLSKFEGDIRKAAPSLGEHTDEVLSELGYTREEIKELRVKRIITPATKDS